MTSSVSIPSLARPLEAQKLPSKVLRSTELVMALFDPTRVMPKQAKRLLSGLAMGSVCMAGNYNGLYRNIQGTLSALAARFPGTILDSFVAQVSGSGPAQVYHASGMVTGLNLLIGLSNIVHSFDDIAYTGSIGDSRGKLKSQFNAVRAGSQALAGASFLAVRPLGMIAAAKGVSIGAGFHAPTLLGRVTFGSLFTGLMSYTAFFGLLIGNMGVDLYEEEKLRRKLDKASELPEQLQVLKDKLNVDPKKVLDKLIKAHGEDGARSKLIDEAYNSGSESLKQILKEFGLKPGSDESLRSMVKQVIEGAFALSDPKDIHELVETYLMDQALKVRSLKLTLKKESKLARAMGPKALAAIKQTFASETNLIDRVKKGDEKAQEVGKTLMGKVYEGLNFKRKQASVLIAIFIIGIIAMLTSAFLLSGTGFLVATVIMLISSILMLGVGAYFLLQSYKGEQAAQHDKKMLVLSMILCIASFMTAVGLSLGGVVTLGVFPLVVMAVLATLWLGQNAVTWKIMNRNEKRAMEKNPTLDNLIKLLGDGNPDKNFLKVYANLSEDLKKLVDAEKKDSGMKNALETVKNKIEEQRKLAFEQLRESLLQHNNYLKAKIIKYT